MNGKQRTQWNEIRRQPCSEHSDTEIAKRARSVLRWKIRYDSIQVTAEKGHLTLFGEVNWNLDREAAEQTVRKLSGVTGVTNLLTAKDCAESATFLVAVRTEQNRIARGASAKSRCAIHSGRALCQSQARKAKRQHRPLLETIDPRRADHS